MSDPSKVWVLVFPVLVLYSIVLVMPVIVQFNSINIGGKVMCPNPLTAIFAVVSNDMVQHGKEMLGGHRFAGPQRWGIIYEHVQSRSCSMQCPLQYSPHRQWAYKILCE